MRETNDEVVESDEVLVIERALNTNLTLEVVHILSLLNELDCNKSSFGVNPSVNNAEVSGAQMFFQDDSQRTHKDFPSFNNCARHHCVSRLHHRRATNKPNQEHNVWIAKKKKAVSQSFLLLKALGCDVCCCSHIVSRLWCANIQEKSHRNTTDWYSVISISKRNVVRNNCNSLKTKKMEKEVDEGNSSVNDGNVGLFGIATVWGIH